MRPTNYFTIQKVKYVFRFPLNVLMFNIVALHFASSEQYCCQGVVGDPLH